MSKRLQVLISDEEMESIERQAQIESISIGEYVRRSLREVQGKRPSKSPSAKLEALRASVAYSFPIADVEQMNREIERGYRP